MYWFNPVYNKKPQGASLKGQTVEYVLKIEKQIGSTAVNFCFCKDFCEQETKIKMKVEEEQNKFVYTANVTYLEEGLYWYYFEVYQNEYIFYLQSNNFEVEPTGFVTNKFQQTVCSKFSKTGKGFAGGIMYHIFVDRFCKVGKVVARNDLVLREDWGGDLTKNSKDFKVINKECFGGNIKGIISKLSYLKSLNVSTLYLSPIFEANSYHKYDTANYNKIDSMFGTEKDFDNLIKKAKELNINVILDGVFNHTGEDSVYFNKYGTYKDLGAYQSNKSFYYNWYNFQEYPNKYDSWWGIESLPQIKKPSKEFTKFLTGSKGVLKKYMQKGILGFRLDVVDELHSQTLSAICSSIKKQNPQALILGEVWEDASNKIAYNERKKYFTNAQLDSVMNYPLKDSIINYVLSGNCNSLKNTTYMLLDHYPAKVIDNLMNILDTHDTPRLLSILLRSFEEELAIKRFKIATLLQFAFKGVPSIFYGDEQGLLGEEAPFCRKCFEINLKNKTLFNWCKKLGSLRCDQSFAKGNLNIYIADNAVFGFDRVVGKHTVRIITNCGQNDYIYNNSNKKTFNYLTNKVVKNKVKVAPNDCLILICDD